MKIFKFAALTLVQVLCNVAFADSDWPSGCSTVTKCTEAKNAQGQFDGKQTCVNFYKPEIKLVDATWKKGKLDGRFWCARDDGSPVIETYFVDGQKNGEEKSNWDSKTSQWRNFTNYKNGKRDGISKYMSSGDAWNITYYQSDKQQGQQLHIDSKGNLLSRNNCEINGENRNEKECENILIPGYESLMTATANAEATKKNSQGNRIVETKRNGKVIERYELRNGKIEGKRESFFPDGKLASTYTYADGKKIAKGVVYFETGTLEKEEFFENGEAVSGIDYFQNGQKKRIWKREPIQKWEYRIFVQEFYDSGKPSLSASELHNASGDWVYDGDYVSYDENGLAVLSGRYENGQETGLWKRLDMNRGTEFEESYEKGILTKTDIYQINPRVLVRHKEFMPDGSIKSDVEIAAPKKQNTI